MKEDKVFRYVELIAEWQALQSSIRSFVLNFFNFMRIEHGADVAQLSIKPVVFTSIAQTRMSVSPYEVVRGFMLKIDKDSTE